MSQNGNIALLFKDNTSTSELESPALNRVSYGSNTFYVKNPNGVSITLEVSPDGNFWVPLQDASTEEAFIVHSLLNSKFIRATRSADAGTVTVWVISGGLAHL